MTYIVQFNEQFAVEFVNYPATQQNAVMTFAQTFQLHGLSDFTRYQGKISPSWAGLAQSDPNYNYTKSNALWHYHIGIPNYQVRHNKYMTSDVVLHFEWPNQGSEISLVDTYDHYRADGSFYIPPPQYLSSKP